MEDDLHQFSKTFTSEFSVDTLINSLWTSFKTKSLSAIRKHVPSKMTSSRCSQSYGVTGLYVDYTGGNTELFIRPGRTATGRTGPDIRIYRRPARMNARKHTIVMSMIWSMTHQTARNYTPSSKIRNVTAQAWSRLRKTVPPIMMQPPSQKF